LNHGSFSIHFKSIFRQIPSPATNKGAFNFFKPEDHQAAKTRASPSSHPTSSVKDDRKGIARSDDEEGETHHLKGNDLKLKLKEEKRHGKKTGELLNKLHENYEELLQKYAHAENTIDQLRFQPKIFGDNTPKSHTSEVTNFPLPPFSIITSFSSI
jgi:hypothetical protein